MANGSIGPLLHALDVEVHIPAPQDGKPPVWAQRIDDANHWTFDTVQNLFRDIMSAKVQTDRDRPEQTQYTQHLSVFALPMPQHAAIVLGDLQGLERRLEADLAARFTGHGAPKVKISPIRTFVSEGGPARSYGAVSGYYPGQGGGYGSVPAVFQPPTQPWANMPPPPPPPPPPGHDAPMVLKGRAVMMLGIMLGGLMIATLAMLWWGMDLRSQRTLLTGRINEVQKQLDRERATVVDLQKEMNRLRTEYTYKDSDDVEIADLKRRINKLSADKLGYLTAIPDRPEWSDLYPRVVSEYKGRLNAMIDELERAKPRPRPVVQLPPPNTPLGYREP